MDPTTADGQPFAITVGAGRTRPQGRRVIVAAEASVAALLAALRKQPRKAEGWWSAHLWEGDYRESTRWAGTHALVADIDYHDSEGRHAVPPPSVAARLVASVMRPCGSIFHPTPRGGRLVAVLNAFLDDPDLFALAARGFGYLVDQALRELGLAAVRRRIRDARGEREAWCDGYKVDDPALADRARFYYLPNARVDGVDRVDLSGALRDELYDAQELASLAPVAPEGEGDAAGPRDGFSREIDAAVAAYNRDHAREWPRSGGTCPACGHHGSFGTLPGTNRWTCFSASHESDSGGCGLPGSVCWHGDALDLDAHAAKTDRIEFLRLKGYLDPRGPREEKKEGSGRSWSLSAGEYVIINWPKKGRPLLVTLELRLQGLRVHRDKVDLNSRKSRKSFVDVAAGYLGDMVEGAAGKIDRDLRDMIGLVEATTPVYGAVGEGIALTVADELVVLAKDAEYFHDAADRAFARIAVDEHKETWPVRSTRFKNWLRRQYHRVCRQVPNTQALNDAIGTLEGIAQIDGPLCEVHVRAAWHEGAIYIDLGRVKWEAIRVDANGWEIVTDPPVRFTRPPGLGALPVPVRGGSLRQLRPFVNLRHESDWLLYQAWLVASLRPGRPFAVLVLCGEQGSAKSTAVRIARSLIDPNRAALRSAPQNEHDLVIAARNGWCLAYDNLSHVPAWLSDALCRIATGSGFGTRRLYTDDEEEIFEACRPIAVNGIEEVATRGDLVDRALLLFLDRIREEDRRDEERFWADFAEAHPRILGALLDALSTALRRLPDVALPCMPRMADFARLGVAAEPAFGCPEGAFLAAYLENRRGALAGALEASVFGKEFQAFANALKEPFVGTATELLEALNSGVDERTRTGRGWPKAPNALKGMLKRLAPSLRSVGIEIEFQQGAGSASRKRIRVWPEKIDAHRRTDANPPPGRPDGVDHTSEGTL
ncbi:MAG: hypothetical protein L6Q95_10330 [Planctomycetes bacterium]|nr:hypothetical protein [Planctomycetota bacterium]